MTTSHREAHRRTGRRIAVTLAAWAGAVAWAGHQGLFAALPLPVLPALIVLGVAAPTALWFLSPALRARVEAAGLRRLTALHVWRVPAALAFFWYGSQGLLPATFVALAGWGDLAAGLAAAAVVLLAPRSRPAYLAAHGLGALDFVVAVGTGLTFWFLEDPAMRTIATFPIVLIPLFGVAVSGATHVVAFDLLRRGEGLGDGGGAARAARAAGLPSPARG